MPAWRDAGQFDLVRGRALTWLLVICRSRSLDYLRRCDEAEPHPNPTSLVAEALCDIVNPEDMTMLLERDHAISDALVKLLPIQRQLVVLSFFRGYSHLEMARYTHIPLGTVKTHIRNALMSMKNSMSLWRTDGA